MRGKKHLTTKRSVQGIPEIEDTTRSGFTFEEGHCLLKFPNSSALKAWDQFRMSNRHIEAIREKDVTGKTVEWDLKTEGEILVKTIYRLPVEEDPNLQKIYFNFCNLSHEYLKSHGSWIKPNSLINTRSKDPGSWCGEGVHIQYLYQILLGCEKAQHGLRLHPNPKLDPNLNNEIWNMYSSILQTLRISSADDLYSNIERHHWKAFANKWQTHYKDGSLRENDGKHFYWNLQTLMTNYQANQSGIKDDHIEHLKEVCIQGYKALKGFSKIDYEEYIKYGAPGNIASHQLKLFLWTSGKIDLSGQ